eukprot:TRINITY_DN15704_c0_g1_i1.p1 TRINITY_DN15704_c0_g1~~TRINITY_DN15704_c0_g1_i1.p1  ORF type:complete len:821 (+),score=131.59 TRINITY_DN15704_c0_g1_i1:258-2720(+)
MAVSGDADASEATYRVFVSGLEEARVTSDDGGIREEDNVGWFFFDRGCNVTDVKLVVDPVTERSRGFAFVDFGDRASFIKALSFSGTREAPNIGLDATVGSTLHVEEAWPAQASMIERQRELVRLRALTRSMEKDIQLREERIRRFERELTTSRQRRLILDAVQDIEGQIQKERLCQKELREVEELLFSAEVTLHRGNAGEVPACAGAVERPNAEAETASAAGLLAEPGAADTEVTKSKEDGSISPLSSVGTTPELRVKNTFIEFHMAPRVLALARGKTAPPAYRSSSPLSPRRTKKICDSRSCESGGVGDIFVPFASGTLGDPASREFDKLPALPSTPPPPPPWALPCAPMAGCTSVENGVPRIVTTLDRWQDDVSVGVDWGDAPVPSIVGDWSAEEGDTAAWGAAAVENGNGTKFTAATPRAFGQNSSAVELASSNRNGAPQEGDADDGKTGSVDVGLRSSIRTRGRRPAAVGAVESSSVAAADSLATSAAVQRADVIADAVEADTAGNLVLISPSLLRLQAFSAQKKPECEVGSIASGAATGRTDVWIKNLPILPPREIEEKLLAEFGRLWRVVRGLTEPKILSTCFAPHDGDSASWSTRVAGTEAVVVFQHSVDASWLVDGRRWAGGSTSLSVRGRTLEVEWPPHGRDLVFEWHERKRLKNRRIADTAPDESPPAVVTSASSKIAVPNGLPAHSDRPDVSDNTKNETRYLSRTVLIEGISPLSPVHMVRDEVVTLLTRLWQRRGIHFNPGTDLHRGAAGGIIPRSSRRRGEEHDGTCVIKFRYRADARYLVEETMGLTIEARPIKVKWPKPRRPSN